MWTYLAKFLAYNPFGLKKLYHQNSHDWKLILMHFINNAFGKDFIFHSNLSFKTSVFYQFRTFYTNIFYLTEKKLFSYLTLLYV